MQGFTKCFYKKNMFPVFVFLFFSFSIFLGYTQTDSVQNTPDTKSEIQEQTTYAPLSMGFADITLQNSKEDVITKLKEDDMFVYRGEPDISFLPSSRNQILRVNGKKFLRQAIFQFNTENILVAITLNLNTKLLDYFTVYTTYQNKYGRAKKISPQNAQWANENIKVIIEKPLSIKFLLLKESDNNVISAGIKSEKQRRENREEFLALF